MQRTLCFDDVLLTPQYSDISSRTTVDLSVPGFDEPFARLTDQHPFLKCPIVGSPMDTVISPAACEVLDKVGGFGVLHRYCTIEESVTMFLDSLSSTTSQQRRVSNVMVAIGATGDYLERAEELYKAGCRLFCVDVAHGHHASVKSALENLNDKFDDIHVMTGNVATLEAFNDLADWGANSIRVGVGGGCFIPGTSITMSDGTKKSIETVKVGDSVLTHTGEVKEVINLFERPFADLLVKINNSLTCTLNHEIYVVENKDIPNVNDENIHEFAKWIPAADLNENYSLVEII
jgi:IMP dehydrogenase/GMP reductase